MARVARGLSTEGVAWGVATWTAPFVPMGAFLLVVPLAAVLAVRPLPEAATLGAVSAALAGAGLALLRASGPRRRGLGWGLLAGGTATAAGALGALAW